MNLINRLALVISIMGAFATWVFLEPLGSLGLQIWAAFLTWGCYYHCGGDVTGLRHAVLGGLWGGAMAAVCFMLIPAVGGGPVGAAICVGVTVAIFILGANIPALSVIPAAVYGYSAVAAFALLKPGADVYAANIVDNPFLNIAASTVIGGILGYASEKIVQAMGRTSTT